MTQARKGFSSLGCPEFSLEEMMDLATKHGLRALELRSMRGSNELPQALQAEFGTPAELLKVLQTRPGIPIVALGTSLRLIGDQQAAREAFLEYVPWAEALGVPRLRVFDGGQALDEGELQDAVQTVNWWRERRAASGWKVDLMVETHNSLLTAPRLRRFLEAAPGTGILWDTHHTWRRGGEDPAVTWHAIRDHVCHVHVKDSVSVPGAKLPYTYVLPGRGEFPMPRLRELLAADRFRGPVILEWERMWHPELLPLEEALSAAQRSAWW